MEKSGGQRTKTFRGITLVPTGTKTTPHTLKLKTPSLNTHTKEKRSTESGNKIAAKQRLLWSHKTY